MPVIVSRFYQTHETAEAAAAELMQAGFDRGCINVVAPAGLPDAQVLAAIRNGGVEAGHARVYATAVQGGETLVSVRPPFGCAAAVTDILHKHAPTSTGMAEQAFKKPVPVIGAPLSAKAGMPLLLDDPAPLSALLSLPVVLPSPPSPRVPSRSHADNPAPFSELLPGPVLTDRPAILSSLAGMPLLSDAPAPLSASLKLPTLTKSKPLTNRSGGRHRPDNPAPFSRLLGLKLLARDASPFSKVLGVRVLSDKPRD